MPKKTKEGAEWVDDEVAPAAAEKTVKKGKKDKKGKKSFFEELATDVKPEKEDEVAVKETQGKQKKKKDRRKGKGGNAADDDDEDVMLKLKKLSVQASDEEDEPVIAPSKGNKKTKGGNIFAALSHSQSDEEEEEDADLDEEDKPARKSPENDVDNKPKKGKKEQQKKGRPAKASRSEDEEEEEEDSDECDTMKLEYERQVASIRAQNALEGDFSISQAEISSRQAMLENASDIKLEKFSISAHGKELFVNADLLIVAGRRYGLVGPNGKGKTTLLKHIANRALSIPPNIDVLLCEQEVVADDTPAVQAVLKADTKRLKLMEEERQLQALLEKGEDSVADRLDKARRILAGLSFTTEMQNRPTKRFSGGWRMRVSLARYSLTKVMDGSDQKFCFTHCSHVFPQSPVHGAHPTDAGRAPNHLDLNAVIWLNNYLQGWKKTLLIVSHDQSFLDEVCTDIIHLDYQKLFYYRGNYLTFKKMYVQKQKEMQKQYDKQEKKLKDLKAGGKSTKQAEKQTKEALTRKQQKGKKKGAQEEESQDATELLKRPKEYTVKLWQRSKIFTIIDEFIFQSPLAVGADTSLPFLLLPSVCIVGPNGVGKSTLLLLLTGKLQPKVGFFNQQYADQLNMEETATEYLMRNFNLPYQDGRKCLGRFGLESHAHTIQISKLSGGQKARVVFAELSCRQPDVLILDEPTNNLDIESIDALSEAINEYKGAVIIVSHDARLITETQCTMWVVEDRSVVQIDGDFDDYKREVLESLGETMVNKVNP
ncbi:hypothetical protein F7725_025684 [Dissostichus mawsoni]|uniref:ABC transporter domain-containing protein n=1 Tax=Dissostichus mawsoni TaxID=36200 RepID=A0A7J5XBV9_DISMA|nr:hypothetical protein F7725_025684 [Dissostichus mawsoni]